ncbi:unnamed protein product [Allacma fusca]|uniref:Uncharacterized protein n=1 Tax=Allacma fusca TaxID=39272 RepID=A0A8J2L957_9HEXA|nr:unnamed protein product [Allacma fusca]
MISNKNPGIYFILSIQPLRNYWFSWHCHQPVEETDQLTPVRVFHTGVYETYPDKIHRIFGTATLLLSHGKVIIRSTVQVTVKTVSDCLPVFYSGAVLIGIFLDSVGIVSTLRTFAIREIGAPWMGHS